MRTVIFTVVALIGSMVAATFIMSAIINLVETHKHGDN